MGLWDSVIPAKTPEPSLGGSSPSMWGSAIKPTSAPAVAPAQKGFWGDSISKAAPAPAAPSPYFESKTPSGAFIGVSTSTDPFSGRPFLAYKLPGESTTTDYTRTAPRVNPEIATTTPRSSFTNERMPQSASEYFRKIMDATSGDQLDHRMALSVGGSNAPDNLKVIPTKENQAAGANEGSLSSNIASGKMSLFEAQNQEAKAKGLPPPWTDQEIKQDATKSASWMASPLSLAINTALGIPGGIGKLMAGKAPLDMSAITGNPESNRGVAAIAANTALGLPGAAWGIVQGVARDMVKIGMTAGQAISPKSLSTPAVGNSANLEQLSAAADKVISKMGAGADSLSAQKKELEDIHIDRTNQASVDAYNEKVDAFDAAVEQFKMKEGNVPDIITKYNDAIKAAAAGNEVAVIPPENMRWLLGSEPIQSLTDTAASYASAIEGSKFAQSVGLSKYANFLGTMGAAIPAGLDFAGAGGEKGIYETIAKSTDAGEIGRILAKIGVQDDLVMPYAQKLATITNPQEVKNALTTIDALQKTTKVAPNAMGNLAHAAGDTSEESAKGTVGTSETNSLSEEAKKYGSADEFIKSQGEPLYHGTSIESAQDITQNGFKITDSGMNAGNGISLTDDKAIADIFGENGATVNAVLAKDAKLVTPREFLMTKNAIGEKDGFDEATQKAIDFYKKKGYDGVDFRKGNGGIPDTLKNEVRIWNPEKITTKEKLTSIYNEATQKNIESKDLIHTIANTKSPSQIEALLKTTGIAPEEVKPMAQQLANVSNPKKVQAIIEGDESAANMPDRQHLKFDETGRPLAYSARESRIVNGLQPIDKIMSGEVRSGSRVRPPKPEGLTKNAKPFVPQGTSNKIKLAVQGKGVVQRVRNAIGMSEALKTQIVNKGQEAVLAGRKLSTQDLKIVRDMYQAGKPIEEIAAHTANPVETTAFIKKLENYYDYQLAADRASGGSTTRVERYLPQNWNLNDPMMAARFDELSKQKGIQQYPGYRSRAKIFENYAEGEAAGFQPKHATILGDLEAHYEGASRSTATQALKQGLQEAVPHMVSLSGYGRTDEGKAFINSNIPGMEGISYHPDVSELLQGYEALKHPDFINLVKKAGAEAAIEHTGIASWIDKTVAMAKAIPKSAEEAGMAGILGSIYDHASGPMKALLWNWSGFHSANITLSHLGASILHPATGIKGVVQSVGAAMSEHLYNAVIDNYKGLMVGKDATGKPQSVFDWAVESGAYEPRELPAQGLSKANPFKVGQRAIFDREIPVLQLNLAEQAAKKGIVASSPEGLALGKEIRTITGEINPKTMNLNPNNIKVGSRFFLAPGFTYSKYRTVVDAATAWRKESKFFRDRSAGNLARTAVLGKTALVGTIATLGTLLMTGKFPNLSQLLLNFTFNPTVQTNLTNPKGQKLDITFPKTFVSELAGLFSDPIGYGNARLNPIIGDFLKIKSNEDYYGNPIIDPNVQTSAIIQILQNIGIGHLPIGMQSVIKDLQGKWSGTQAGIAIGGLNTKVSASDPTSMKYAGIDKAIADIQKIAPDDTDRLEKMQAIFNSIPPEDRGSLAYQEMMSGVSTKGIYQSETEQKYFQVQALLQKGDTAGAAAITKAMTPKEYSTYKSIKTRAVHEATFQKVKDLVAKGDVAGAKALTGAMSKQVYSSYLTWKKNNS